MAARKPIAPRALERVQVPRVDDSATNRALGVVSAAVQKVQSTRQRYATTSDLVVGTNKVQHSLGRACNGYSLTPTVADATFAHAINTSNPHPELEVWITVVGVAQPDARIEVY